MQQRLSQFSCALEADCRHGGYTSEIGINACESESFNKQAPTLPCPHSVSLVQPAHTDKRIPWGQGHAREFSPAKCLPLIHHNGHFHIAVQAKRWWYFSNVASLHLQHLYCSICRLRAHMDSVNVILFRNALRTLGER